MRSSPVVGAVLVVAGLLALTLGGQDLLGVALVVLGVVEVAVVLVRRRSSAGGRAGAVVGPPRP